MKVIGLNGSPHQSGSTNAALDIVFDILNKEGFETEKIQIGNDTNKVCIGCFKCNNMTIPQCIFTEDKVNELVKKCINVDGIILGSPVHFSGITGGIKSFLDRFYVSR